jgi:hypothetical protein
MNFLDKKGEQNLLTPHKINLKSCLNNHLAQLLQEEEVKWYKGKKTKHLQGDMTTKYFHLLSNGKHSKMRIFQLQDDDNIIEGDVALKKYITSYYIIKAFLKAMLKIISD